MPLFITGTHSSDENYNGNCDWAVLNITQEKARMLLILMNQVQKYKDIDSSFYSCQLWEYFDCYSTSTLRDSLTNEIEDKGYDTFLPFPAGETLNQDGLDTEPTECHLLTVTNDTLEWECLVKDTRILISSSVVYRPQLEAWAKGEWNV